VSCSDCIVVSKIMSLPLQIKGGGRAVLSSECQKAIVSLLMQLEKQEGVVPATTGTVSATATVINDTSTATLTLNNNDSNRNLTAIGAATSESFSIQQQEQLERQFVTKLVQQYERLRLTNQYNHHQSDSTKSGGGGGSVSDTTTGKNVRIEIAVAVFKKSDEDSSNSYSKSSKNQESSSDKNEDDTSNYDSSRKKVLPFQSNMKKVVLLPRSTTMEELYRQAKAKFRIKAKLPFVRAFIIVQDSATSPFLLFDLKKDLSGIQDGTTVYVTPTKNSMTMSDSSLTIADKNDPDGLNCDQLEQVKHAYASLINRRRHSQPYRTSERSKNKQKVDHPIIDSDLVAERAHSRAKLPAAACKSDILLASQTHPVVILSGATGSGKSTQVPQFLFEHHHATTVKDGDTMSSQQRRRPYIVVTQPHRIAAISLARRVSEEMGCPPPGAKGSLVGYIVRLDRRVAEGTCRIIYCTVGVLLRMLVCPQNEIHHDDDSSTSVPPPPLSLNTISHLILDDVHDRDVETDFCLTVLRSLLGSQQFPHLRLILMSATASVDFFVNYFASIATTTTLEILGRTFPVQTNWLSDCEHAAEMSLCDYGGGQASSTTSYIHSDVASVNDGPRLSPRAHQKIDYRLILGVIRKIILQQQAHGQLEVSSSSPSTENKPRKTGAILVFLPGKAEIEALAKCLYNDRGSTIGDRNLCRILKLHSSMQRDAKQDVFQPVHAGIVKIVLATNVAE
jgi:hypothetical protein